MSITAWAPAVQTPPKWHAIYQGDEECTLFKELARGEHDWRTLKGLASSTKLSQNKIESIISKYLPTGIIQQHQSEADKFRYWERSTKTKTAGSSIAEQNQKKRVDDAGSGSSSVGITTKSGSSGGSPTNQSPPNAVPPSP